MCVTSPNLGSQMVRRPGCQGLMMEIQGRERKPFILAACLGLNTSLKLPLGLKS
jgi:hypothetical protein